jgi:predicted ATPase
VILYYQKHDIIFIEEPEKGIHPSLISDLVNKFYDVAKYKNKQIFFTSHNEEILKNIYHETELKDIFL